MRMETMDATTPLRNVNCTYKKMNFSSRFGYTAIPSDDSEENETNATAAVHSASVTTASVKGYIYSPECQVYHTTKGHYNANFPITDTTDYIRCTRCGVTNNHLVAPRIVYISSSAAKVYHDTKGHYNADIPTVTTIGRVHCTRCRLPARERAPEKTQRGALGMLLLGT